MNSERAPQGRKFTGTPSQPSVWLLKQTKIILDLIWVWSKFFGTGIKQNIYIYMSWNPKICIWPSTFLIYIFWLILPIYIWRGFQKKSGFQHFRWSPKWYCVQKFLYTWIPKRSKPAFKLDKILLKNFLKKSKIFFCRREISFQSWIGGQNHQNAPFQ